jgi:hypothetical protein
MEIFSIKNTPLSFKLVSTRVIKLSDEVDISIYTDQGTFRYALSKGLRTDGRSGGKLVDLILPHYGNEKYALCWLVHDVNFNKHCLSFPRTNILFREMLRKAGIGRFRSWLAYRAVNSKLGLKMYEDQDKNDTGNHDLIKFYWDDNKESEIEQRRRQNV